MKLETVAVNGIHVIEECMRYSMLVCSRGEHDMYCFAILRKIFILALGNLLYALD